MDLKKRNDFRHFATWLRDMDYLTEKFVLIPYELAELYLESNYYKNLQNSEGAHVASTESKLNLADVTGSALLTQVKQFRKEQQELHDFTKKEGHPKVAEYTEGGLDVCDKLIKIIEKHYR